MNQHADISPPEALVSTLALPTRVVVINDHSTSNGGTAALALLSIRHLRARGIPVTLICGDDGENPELKALGVEVCALGSADLLKLPGHKAAMRGIHYKAALALVKKVIAKRDNPSTIYHVHGWAQILSPAIFRALDGVAPRTYLHAHDAFLACPNGMYMDYQRGEVCTRHPLSASCITTHCDKRSYGQKLWRVAPHSALFAKLDRQAPWAGLITIHPDVGEKFIRAGYPSDLIRVLRNPAKPYRAVRIRAEEHATLVYVGRLERDKGVMDLVEAAARSATKLRLIGDGALSSEIAARFANVELAGWQSTEQITALVQDARALVMPSHHPEPFALVLPEAIQSGLPVLVSDTALMAAEIEAGGFGQQVTVPHAAGFAGAIAPRMALPRAEMAEMSTRGFTSGAGLSMTQHSWAEGLLSLYGTALH
jgi:glycosyltransferase involved in cell wall biosynthesis